MERCSIVFVVYNIISKVKQSASLYFTLLHFVKGLTMKNFVFLIFWGFVTVGLKAQTKHNINLRIAQPGLEYQIGINNDILATIDLGFGVTNLSYNSRDGIELYLTTLSNLSIKKVYNYNKVIQNNSKLLPYSGNYYGLRSFVYNKDVSNRAESESFNIAFGPIWGVQRYYKVFYYQFELGLGYYRVNRENDIAPLVRACVGINLKRW